MINKKHGYSTKTKKLIDRMCRNVEREDFELDKNSAEECILKTYDLFNLPRPKKIVWCVDIFDKKFADYASYARSARHARSAWFAGSAWCASSASSARSAKFAWCASSASYASSARSARSAKFAWCALDYDFDYYVFEFEYCQNPSGKKPNKNDKDYLEYCELLMKAKECGLGYWAEYQDVLCLALTPIVRIDEQNRFHSTKESAIRWKDGKEIYYIHGVKFKKEWWEKIVNDRFTAEEVFAIDNLEHRRIAYEYMDKIKMKELKDYEVLDETTDVKGNKMRIVYFKIKEVDEPLKYLNCICPSTGREYYIGTDKDKCEEAKSASFGLEDVEWVEEF